MFMLMFLFGLISFVTALFIYSCAAAWKSTKATVSAHTEKRHGETSGYTLA